MIERPEFEREIRRVIAQEVSALPDFRSVLAYPRRKVEDEHGHFELTFLGFTFGTMLSCREIVDLAPPWCRRVWTRKGRPLTCGS